MGFSTSANENYLREYQPHAISHKKKLNLKP